MSREMVFQMVGTAVATAEPQQLKHVQL